MLRLLGVLKGDTERETLQEIEAHIELRVEALVAQGVPEEEARRRAIARFGDLDEARRRIDNAARRRDRRLTWMERWEGVQRDVRLAARRIARHPGHSALTISIFGLGIGLATTMFTFVDGVLLRPLPFPEPHRLVALYSVPEDGRAFPWVSMGNWYDWEHENGTLSSSAIHSQEARDVTVATAEGSFTAPGVTVYGPFFETIRPLMAAGRFPSADEVAGSDAPVVVSERFWRGELGATPLSGDVTVVLDGRTRSVVGVVARGHEHPEGIDLWLPSAPRPQVGGARNNINFVAVGRLAEGATIEQAEEDLSVIARGIRRQDPEAIYSYGVEVHPLQEAVVGAADDYLGTLMGAVLLVLLIGSANLAALGFARGRLRRDEIAVRLSLGAERSTVVRHLLSEELLLALLGGAVGVALAWSGSAALMDRVADVLPRSRDVSFDGRVVAFGLAVSVFAGLAAGLPPALGAARKGVARSLTGARAIGGRRGLPGALMVSGEVAMTILLLTGAGLMLMSFTALASRDLGYDPEGVVTVDVALTGERYREAPQEAIRYWETSLAALEELPGVESVGAGVWIPTGGSGTGFIDVEGRPLAQDGAGYRVIGGEYFRTLRVPLLQGRAFDDRDRFDSEAVTIINETMAKALWPSQSPLGKRVRAVSMESYWFAGEAPWRTVVGVVGDIRHHSFESDFQAEMYVPFRQNPWISTAMSSLVRARGGDADALLAPARRTASRLDPSLAVEVSTLEGRLHRTLSERRMIVALLTSFAVAALLLASLGIYGVLSHAAASRTRELAIRSALGARRTGLVRLVLAEALRLVAAGSVVGISLALGLRGVLDALLVEVHSGDPRAYALATACLAVVATLAALIPAVRAARMDPLEALRDNG